MSFVQPGGSRSTKEDAADASSVKHHETIATTAEPSDIHASAALPTAHIPNTTNTVPTLHWDTNPLTSITEPPSVLPSPEVDRKKSNKRKRATKESHSEVPETGSADITRNSKEANELPRQTQTQTPIEHARKASTSKAMATKESSASVSGTQIGLYRCILFVPVLLKLLQDTKAKETQSTAGNLLIPGDSFVPFPR